jgi:hypothetical protein
MEMEMKTGLLWFDDSPRMSLADKVVDAVRRYEEKFGRSPNVCYVHPSAVVGAQTPSMGVRVVVCSGVQPNHFWVGVV